MNGSPERRLRVAAVVQSYLPVLGGLQTQIHQLGPLLSARGIDVPVLTRRVPADTPPIEREDGGLTVRRLRVGSARGPAAGARASLAYTAQGLAQLARLRPDVVHSHDLLSPATIGLLGSAALRVPLVALVASTGPGGDIDRLLHKPLGAARLRLLVRRVAVFHTQAAETEAELRAHGVPAERLLRVINGVDTERFRPRESAQRAATRARLGVPSDAVVAIYCGRFAPVKRLDLLLEAFADAPAGCHLLLVGGGEEEGRLRELASRDGLAGRVHVHGAVPDTAELLGAADLYVSSSETEGMSHSVLESMASALPVVASPASGMAALVNERTGALARDFTLQALRDALHDVAGAAPDARSRLGAAAREQVERGHSLAATADTLADLYRRLADGRRR